MLRAEALHHTYPGAAQASLTGVSLHIGAGQVLGLLGPNGAGKSTLMALLAGLLPIQAGRVSWQGEPLAPRRTGRARHVALAPQSDAFYPMLTVEENLACFAAASALPRREARMRCDQVIAQTQLAPWRHRRAGELSGGVRRRLSLAIALQTSPDVLLLDEPTAGVDPQSRAFILQVLRTRAEAGCALVFSSHLMGEIEALADEVLILDHGRVLRQAPLADLLADEGRTLTLDLPGSASPPSLPPGDDTLHAALGLPAGTPGLAWRRIGDRRLIVTLPETLSPVQALARLEAAGIGLQGAAFGRASLEHTFMAMTDGALRDE